MQTACRAHLRPPHRRFERRKQPFCQLSVRFFEGAAHGFDNLRTHQDVALSRPSFPLKVAGPRGALGPV